MLGLNESSSKKILITSVGGNTGVFLTKHFINTSSHKLVGIDMDNLVPVDGMLHSFYQVPPIKSKDYLNIVLKIVEQERIDMIIPVTSYDVDFFSDKMVQEKLGNVKIITMNFEDNLLFSDKATCYLYLKEIGLNSPDIYIDERKISFPAILKPKVGSGSKGIIKLDDREDYIYWIRKYPDAIITSYLDGPEYTVDCLFNREGQCLGYNVRERLKTVSGGATVSKVVANKGVEGIIVKLEKTKKLRGPVNFQFKVNNLGEICIFDFNTRFASGGLPLTVKVGFDIPNLLISLLDNREVLKWEASTDILGVTMIRFYDESFRGNL